MRTRRRSGLLALALLAACGDVDRFVVDGVSSELCVPKDGYIAPDVWFIPEDTPATPRGFSFGGCHWLEPQDRSTCALPTDFIGADVEPLSTKRNEIWSELKSAAIFAAVAANQEAHYSIDPSTSMLVVRSESDWSEWFVWKREDRDFKNMALRDEDLLFVSCADIGGPLDFSGVGNFGEFVCRRYVRGKSYALNYSFVSKIPVPTEQQVLQLESGVFKAVDAWRCAK
jgi:hypothetical protein